MLTVVFVFSLSVSLASTVVTLYLENFCRFRLLIALMSLI